eukprot:gene14281-14431_t
MVALQLWVMALRGVDDVKESVRSAAGGLLRSLRGISPRGLASSVDAVRGVAADVICNAVKSAGPAQVLPVLPAIVPVLLESLSNFEDSRLNYIEQALDASCRALTGPAAAQLAPALVSVVRRGVGLNSKVGTARFIKALAARLRQELKSADGKAAALPLLKALQAAVAAESSSSVKRAYAAAAAALVVHCVSDKRQEKFITDALDSYGAVVVAVEPVAAGGGSGGGGGGNGGGGEPMSLDDCSSSRDDAVRQAGGLLLRELLRESPDTFARHASQDESSTVSTPWQAVWAEGCPSEPAALRLHCQELVGLIAGSLSSSSWPRKKGAAQ